MWEKIREKTKSPKVLMVLIVATSIILASAVYVWAITRTPTIKLNCTEKSNNGTYVDMTWKIESVSRPNVKWHNIKFKVWGVGFPYRETDTYPDDGEFQFIYKPKCIDVRNGLMFKIRFNASRLGGCVGGGIIEIHLIYIPTNDSAGMDRVSAPPAFTPMIGLTSSARSNDGNYVDITWIIESARGDVKWVDMSINAFVANSPLKENTSKPAKPKAGNSIS